MGQANDTASTAPRDRPAGLEVRDPADQRSVVAEVPAMGAGEVAGGARPASGFDQAVELANDSRYGLSAAVRFAW